MGFALRGFGLRGSAVPGPSDQLQLYGLLYSFPFLSDATEGLLGRELHVHRRLVGAMESNTPRSQ